MKQIRNLKLENPFFLAPMAEVNDIAFRMLCKEAGCGLTYTGMINPLTQENLVLDDYPALQLFCTSTKGVREFIKKYEDRVVLFDFNLGCPSKVAKKMGFGVFLHNKLDVIEDILREMRASTDKPITIKIRKSKNAMKIVKIAEKYCDAIGVHPRTAEQGYSGDPDLKFAERVKKKTKLPVIYSGNVNLDNYKELLKKFDFLMVGRAALGHPEIFAKLQDKKLEMGFGDYLKAAKKYKLYFRYLKTQAMYFTLGREDAKEIRRKIAKAKTLKDIEGIFG